MIASGPVRRIALVSGVQCPRVRRSRRRRGEAQRIIAAARTGGHQPYRNPDDQTGYHGAIA